MSDGVTVKVNLAQFKRELREVNAKVEKAITRRAVKAAGEVFVKAAKAEAPVLRTRSTRRQNPRVRGALRGAIRFVPRRGTRALVVGNVTVIASKSQKRKGRNPFYWRFLEGGWIPRGRGQRLRGGSRRRALERRRLVASGARKVSYPFLAPAFQRSGSAALAAFTQRFNTDFAELDRTS